jgi:hypothetical protein
MEDGIGHVTPLARPTRPKSIPVYAIRGERTDLFPVSASVSICWERGRLGRASGRDARAPPRKLRHYSVSVGLQSGTGLAVPGTEALRSKNA